MRTENLTNLSDAILLTRIQSGDDDALVALIEKYERLLKTIIHYEIRNAEEEADIYSETRLAIVLRIRRQSDDIESAEQWLKQIARSKCKAFLVDAKKRGIIREYAEDHHACPAEQEVNKRMCEYHLQERLHEIREIVEEKAPACVCVLELWLQGLTEAASAAELKIPQNTAKSRRNKIRKVVRECLGVSLTSKK